MSDDRRDSTASPAPSRAPIGSDAANDLRKIEAARRAVASVPPTRERGVLVVEDDPDTQWRLARMLTVRGNRVVGTSSAEAALELMQLWPVDLVLVDDGLPGMSGLDLAREIHVRFPTVPVVIMSSEESGRARLAARLSGAVAVIAKPFGLDSLAELLRSLPGSEAELVPAE